MSDISLREGLATDNTDVQHSHILSLPGFDQLPEVQMPTLSQSSDDTSIVADQ